VERQERDEYYPWMRDLSDEQCLKIWRTLDRSRDWKGWEPGGDRKITTDAEAILHACVFIDPTFYTPEELEDFEDELQYDEEYELVIWLRKLRQKYESEEEEQARYEGYEEQIKELNERIARRRRRESRN
jgi:hypothetical protein